MIPKNSKEEIIQRLLVTKQKAHTLEIRLRIKGDEDQADEVAQKANDLTKQIDALLGQVMDEWQGQAPQIIGNVKTANTNLQRSIAEIKNNINTAQNIVKAVGLLDDVISIAKGLAVI